MKQMIAKSRKEAIEFAEVGDNGYGTTEHALKSAHDALWAIASMQITENTDKGEVLALCMAIARIELEKGSTAGK